MTERDELLAEVDRTEEDEARLAELEQEAATHSETAIERFETGLERAGSLDLNVKLGQVYLLIERWDDAEDEFRRVIVQSPYRVEAYVGLAEVLAARGDTEGALENLHAAYARSLDDLEKEQITKRILDFDPDDITTRLRLAKAFAAQYKWTAATREYATVLEADPDLVEAYIGIAEAYRWRNEPATAIEYLQRGLERASYESERIALNEAIVEAAQYEAGSGRALAPVGLDARISLAELYLEQGRLDKAAEQLELVRTDDMTYRADEVLALLIEAGVEEPEQETPADSETTSEGDADEIVLPDESSDADPDGE